MRLSYLLVISFILFNLTCSAQITFKRGYFIDTRNNKTECFIKDSDWKNAPSSFSYKLDESGEILKMDTKDVTEFAAGETKYIRAKIRYDQSPQELKKLNIFANPDWVEADVLLRVIVEGTATLYSYNTSELALFFFKVRTSPIEQLIYKSYVVTSAENQVAKNNAYLGQLNSRVRCGRQKAAREAQMPYQQRTLKKHFEEFNICSGDVVKEKTKSERNVAIKITPGVDFTSVKATRFTGTGPYEFDFGKGSSIRLGTEFQFTLPFNHNKWAIVVEPTYHTFSSDKAGGLKYTSIETPIGVRHRFFLSRKSSIFVNGAALLDFPLSHVQKFRNGDYKMTGATFGFAGGAGYSYGRFSLEGRYYPVRERTQAQVMTYRYIKTTIILGVRIF